MFYDGFIENFGQFVLKNHVNMLIFGAQIGAQSQISGIWCALSLSHF